MGSFLTDPRRDRGGIVAGGAQRSAISGTTSAGRGRAQADEDRAAIRLLGEEPGKLEREPRLAGAARTTIVSTRGSRRARRRGLEQLALAAEEPRRGGGQVDRAGRPQRGNSARRAGEPCGRVEVLQPVPSEVPQRLVLEERRVGAETITWPPWASAATRAPRWTSIPT